MCISSTHRTRFRIILVKENVLFDLLMKKHVFFVIGINDIVKVVLQ
jgi:hypothetical protein